jgi:hypothetical protein
MKKTLLLYLFSFVATMAFAQLKENVGIGVRLQLDSTKGYEIPMITNLIPGGSAQQAGLLAGDYIIKVNDKATKNIALKDVVSMITGEEGTNVKLNIERKGSLTNYTIRRGKYKYAASFYQSAVKDNNFCTALTKLMNDAGYNFVNTMDTISAEDKNGNYTSKVKVPGTESTGMAVSIGTSCEIDLGSFSNRSEVNVVGTKFIEQLKICFPEYYYDIQVDKNGTATVNVGQAFSNGYESPILQLFSFYDKNQQKEKLQLRINGGKATRYYSIKTKAENTPFANSLRTIYDDISNDFRNVKGKKHENEGGLFSSGSSWYEISPVPDGARSCSVTEGGMSLGAKNCSCGFFQGSSREDAVNTFNTVFEKMAAALGSEFVYSSDKSDWDMNISKNAETAITFGIKKKQGYESKLPVIVLLFEKYENNSYGVRMLFYQFGF